jgi:integrase/recombinase XerD
MPYQYKREPLSNEEAERLANAAENFEEKIVIFTLLDAGLRVSELAGLTKDNIQWQERRLIIYGKGGPYGKKTKRRVIPMTDRVRRVLEHHFAFENDFGMSARTIQRIVKRVANQAGIAKPVSPHVLQHTFSVSCIKKGISARSLMQILGHDRLSTTNYI